MSNKAYQVIAVWVLSVLSVGIFSGRTIVFAGNPPASDKSYMLVSSGTVMADGTSSFTITITLRDSSSAVLSGDTVHLSASDSRINISPSSATLNGSGQATFTLKSSYSGTSTISVTDETTSTTFSFPGDITFSPTPTQSPIPTPFGTCNDAAPPSPRMTSAVSGGAHTIILKWDPVSPVKYYLVAYGTSAGNYIYGNPDVGNTTSYTVGSLVTAKKYYFAVKAVNGCMPSGFSNELSASAGVATPTPEPTEADMPRETPTVAPVTAIRQEPSDTPNPTQGPPITPVPKAAEPVSRTMVFSIIGGLLLISGIAIAVVNMTGTKKKNPPPETPLPMATELEEQNGHRLTDEIPPVNNPENFS